MLKLRAVLLSVGFLFICMIPFAAGWTNKGPKPHPYDDYGNPVTNGWVLSGNDWYFFDAEGIMLADSAKTYLGVTYLFDSNGTCVLPYTYNGTYTNPEFGYSITIPPYAAVSVWGVDECRSFQAVDLDLTGFEPAGDTYHLRTYNHEYVFDHLKSNIGADPQTAAAQLEEALISGGMEGLTFIGKSDVYLGELMFTKLVYQNPYRLETYVYTYAQGDKLIIITGYSNPGRYYEPDILQTIKKLSG